MKKLSFAAVIVAVSAAFGASAHRITLDKPAVVAGTELKPGEYKLEVEGEKVTISNKKSTVETSAQVQTATGEKFRSTTMCCIGDDGKYNLQEIRIGGTNQKLVLSNQTAPAR